MDIAKEKRKWLWPLGRLMGLLPVSFKQCVCSSGPSSYLGVSRGSEHLGDATLPPWDPGRLAKDCACPVAARSVPWMVYSLCVMSVLLPMSMYAVYSDRQEAAAGRPSLRMSTKTDELVTFCDILSISACSLICFLQVAFSQGSLFQLLEQLQQVDRLLMMRPPAVPGVLALWLVILIVIMLMDASMWTELNQGLMYATTYLPFYGLYLNTFMMEVLFVDEAHSVHMRLLALNHKLEAALALPSYQAATEQQLSVPMDQGWVDASPRTVSISGLPDSAITISAMYPSKMANSTNNAGRRSRMRPAVAAAPPPPSVTQPVTIQRLNMAHYILCESTFSIARRYGLSLLGDMLCLLLHLVITAYFLLKHLILPSLPAGVSNQYILMQAVWLAAHLGRMFIIVLPCSRASAEASRTGALVGVVLSTTSPSTLAHKQLETFSIQLLHHRVNFNACGLFELGLPLVVSILGAVTTYLVVLLQLKGSPAPGSGNSTVTS